MATTRADTQIIANAAQGLSTRQVAARIPDVSHSTVARRMRAPEIRAEIDKLHAELMSRSLAQAADNVQHMIDNYKVPGLTVVKTARDGSRTEQPQFDEQLREHGFRASMELLRSVGILPSQGTSILVQNIYNDNRTNEIPPEIAQLLGIRVHDQVVDAEYEEIGE
jgi:hypothetical protein